MNTPPQKSPTSVPSAGKRRSLPIGMMVSVGLHAIFFCVLLTVKVVQYITEPEPATLVSAQKSTPSESPKEVKQKIEKFQRVSGGGRPPASVVAMDGPSEFVVPRVEVSMTRLRGKIGGRVSGTGLGISGGSGEGPYSDGHGPNVPGKPIMKLLDIPVEAERLGVVVDNSGSMRPHLDELRRDIEKKFGERTDYAEANGCALTLGSPAFKAIKAMAEGGKVDAIFWFSDLNDPLDMEAIDALGEVLLSHKVKFYVRSILRKPTEDTPTRTDKQKEGRRLLEIIAESGGRFKVQKM